MIMNISDAIINDIIRRAHEIPAAIAHGEHGNYLKIPEMTSRVTIIEMRDIERINREMQIICQDLITMVHAYESLAEKYTTLKKEGRERSHE